LLYLIARTAGVFLSAASVNDAARRPIAVLKDVPSWAMCVELERFVDQVRTELIAISGMKFFHMTRCMILNVAATVFTYELVMLQLDHDSINPPDHGFCD
jgi:gustatory receptor